MLRYHYSANQVDLNNANNRARFEDDVLRMMVVPVWMKGTHETVRSSNAGNHYDNSRKVCVDQTLNVFTRLDSSSTTDYDFNIESSGPHANLPIIMLPSQQVTPTQRHALADALKTGAANGTSGALAGAGIGWFVAGPPGAATGALWGAGLLGGGSALVQLIDTMCTNSFRRIVADANQVLIEARMVGLDPRVLESFQRLCNRAIGTQEKDLLRQMVVAFEAEFGTQGAAGLRAMYAAI